MKRIKLRSDNPEIIKAIVGEIKESDRIYKIWGLSIDGLETINDKSFSLDSFCGNLPIMIIKIANKGLKSFFLNGDSTNYFNEKMKEFSKQFPSDKIVCESYNEYYGPTISDIIQNGELIESNKYFRKPLIDRAFLSDCPENQDQFIEKINGFINQTFTPEIFGPGEIMTYRVSIGDYCVSVKFEFGKHPDINVYQSRTQWVQIDKDLPF